MIFILRQKNLSKHCLLRLLYLSLRFLHRICHKTLQRSHQKPGPRRSIYRKKMYIGVFISYPVIVFPRGISGHGLKKLSGRYWLRADWDLNEKPMIFIIHLFFLIIIHFMLFKHIEVLTCTEPDQTAPSGCVCSCEQSYQGENFLSYCQQFSDILPETAIILFKI